MPRRAGLRFTSYIFKHIGKYQDLKCDGTSISCRVCNVTLVSTDPANWKRHVKSATHLRNKKNDFVYATFLCDFIFMCCVSNIPLHILKKEQFRAFWKKYVPNWDLPSRRTADRKLNHMKSLIKNKLKSVLSNKKIWITMGETTDPKGNHVIHVLARVLEPGGPTLPYLLACKRLKRVNAETVQELVTQTLGIMGVDSSQLWMLVTDAVQYMVKAGQLLKNVYPNLIHVTCLVHTLNLVTEEIRRNYPEVDALIANTKQIFVKASKRVTSFKLACPDIQLPPQPLLTHWETWQAAVGYYHEHFQRVKDFILQLNPNESKAISEAQNYLKNPEVEVAIHVIHNNYTVVLDSIQLLENSSLSLEESLHIIHNVKNKLQTLKDDTGMRVSKRYSDILRKNVGYERLCNINRYLNEEHPTSDLESFKFANITLVDVKKSFSLYTHVFTPQRRSFSAENIETVLLMRMFVDAQCQPLSSVLNT